MTNKEIMIEIAEKEIAQLAGPNNTVVVKSLGVEPSLGEMFSIYSEAGESLYLQHMYPLGEIMQAAANRPVNITFA